MKIGSLFTGYGGLDMAVEAVTGARTAWVSDIDKGACKILAHRYPDVPNLGDITAIDWTTVEPVDIITGGYPCQPFSQAGRRKGENDDRHLWPYVRQAIRHLRPRVTILENVAGHRSMGFDRVLGDLAEDGLHARWTSLRAAHVGAPHGRERLFIVVTDPRRVSCAEGRIPAPEEAARGESSAIDRGRDRAPVALLPTPTTQDAANTGGPSQFDRNTRPLNTEVLLLPTPTGQNAHGNHVNGRGESLLPGAVSRLLPTPEASRAGGTPERHLERKRLADGSSRSVVTNLDVLAAGESTDFGQYAEAIARWEVVLARTAPSPTEPTGRAGAHRLSPAFVEWMMGLPAGWITDVPGITRNEALKACGNGVVPQQAAAALRHMLQAAT